MMDTYHYMISPNPGHGRVATQLTRSLRRPWSRGSDGDALLSTAVGAAVRSTSVGGLSYFLSGMVIAQRRKSKGTAHTPR